MKFHKDRTNNKKNFFQTVSGLYKVNSQCFQAVTHPFTHHSQRGLTSLIGLDLVHLTWKKERPVV